MLTDRLKVASLCASFLLVYREVLAGLAADWWNDPNYSHGLIVLPLAGYLIWRERERLASIPPQPTYYGLLLVLGALLLLIAGKLSAELFAQRISLLLAIVGGVLFLAGPGQLRTLSYPLLLLLLSIPLPAIIFYQITFPLQLIASKVATQAISLLEIPALREGNIIYLSNTTLEVVEACSGIRSLFSLMTMGLLAAYFAFRSLPAKLLLVLSTIPIALLANAFRLITTAYLAYHWGAEYADGFFHSFSGWLVFMVSSIFIAGEIKAMYLVSKLF